MSILTTYSLACDGECGEQIDIRQHRKGDDTMAIAEMLGWKTVDRGKKTEVYCGFCQDRAERIVKGK
jgi:hypothetical protein